MAKRNTIPAKCKLCVHLWTLGVKDNKHNMWCTAYQGGPAWKLIGHCKNTNYSRFKLKEK